MAMQQNYYADFSATGSAVDPAEVAKFSKLSEEWWDPRVARNAMRPLGTWGAINTLPVRLSVLSCSLVTGGRENAGPIPA